MISITSSKIAGFSPDFQAFRGFSLLFDTPGGKNRTDQLVPTESKGNELELYQMLHAALDKLDISLLTNTYLFCPLPYHSYHTTVWDGVNDENLPTIVPEHRDYFRAYLNRIDRSLRLEAPFEEMLASSSLISKKDWSIRLKFKELAIWTGGPAMVARLEGADLESQEQLEVLERERKALYQSFEALLGIKMYRKYTPHISLGYFANKESAYAAIAQLPVWNSIFEEYMEGRIIQYDRISLYGFLDMSCFYNASMLSYLRQSSLLDVFYQNTGHSMKELADIQRAQRLGVLYFMGGRVDHRFGFQNDYAGVLHSALPTDYEKAMRPGIHASHDEIMICTQGKMVIEYCQSNTETIHEKVLTEGQIFTIKKGWPHRISLSPLISILEKETIDEKALEEARASFMALKTGDLNDPKKPFLKTHPLHHRWQKDQDYLEKKIKTDRRLLELLRMDSI